MLVMKFGGSSMGSASRMSSVASIIAEKARVSRVTVIVSAVSGISNFLQDSINFAIEQFYATDKTPLFTSTARTKLKDMHQTIITDLKSQFSSFSEHNVLSSIEPYLSEFEKLLEAIVAFGECPESIEARLMGLGEQICVPIIAEVLRAKSLDVQILDSRQFIITEGSLTEGDVVYEETEKQFARFLQGEQDSSGESTPDTTFVVDQKAQVLLAPGFISKDCNGKPSLLGRNGSDFSAALFAFGLQAEKLEIWTDVDGIYTADPRIVSDAVLVKNLSYEEAMELSFFGSKVLHPKTLTPIASRKIETWSLNTLNPSAPGTRITSSEALALENRAEKTARANLAAGDLGTNRASETPQSTAMQAGPVRGVTCLKNTALISVTGAGLKGKKGIAARTFAAVSRADSSMLLITQSSSEYTISFCVKGNDAHKVKKALEQEFALEMREKLINEIHILPDMAIVSIVGDGMRQKKGIAGTFFSSLAFGQINIFAIAQGSSERSISTVVAGDQGDTAVKIAHRFFFNTAQLINVFLFGTGVVGGKLLDQIKAQQAELKEKGVDIRVCGIANSKSIVLARDGIDLQNWKDLLLSSKIKSSAQAVIDFVKIEKPLNPVCVDSTAAGDLPECYLDFFKAGMHVVTPNKRANSMAFDYYSELRHTANENRRRFLYETNVGAGLPVIGTFQDMLKSGDSLLHFSGVMSGSMSYIFGRLDEGVSFSQAVREAKEKGYTEPDPRDDLSGTDVARKALIIAREAGFKLEMSDVHVHSVFPKSFNTDGSVIEFMERLPEVDAWFAEKHAQLSKENKVLRFAASINGETGIAEVGCLEVEKTSPLGLIKNGENAFVFTSRYYSPIPLVIRGYGAGADVTASGVFADILRTLKW